MDNLEPNSEDPLVKPFIPNYFLLGPTDVLKMQTRIKVLKRRKSPDLDEVTAEILVEVCHKIAEPLVCLFNTWVGERQWLSTLKRALVIPMFKKGNRNETGN